MEPNMFAARQSLLLLYHFYYTVKVYYRLMFSPKYLHLNKRICKVRIY